MKIVTIRIDEDELQQIDTLRGNETRSDYIRMLITNSLKYKEHTNVSGQNTADNRLIDTLQKEADYLKSKLDEALRLLNQAQVLQLQTQKQIPEKIEREWWQFWKK